MVNGFFSVFSDLKKQRHNEPWGAAHWECEVRYNICEMFSNTQQQLDYTSGYQEKVVTTGLSLHLEHT